MLIPVSEHIRRLASMILVDDLESGDKPKKKSKKKTDVEVAEDSDKAKKPVPKIKEEPLKPTKQPKIKPPRRFPDAERKWNKGNKTEKMKDYMQDYRSTGKNQERKKQHR